MRINAFVAQATGLSRRAADQLVAGGRVQINHRPAQLSDHVNPDDLVELDGNQLVGAEAATILFHKPTGYVTSRAGQGSATIYDLLPAEFQALKPIGRLDKDSSGLLLLTNDGTLANQLTHPRYGKDKVYEVALDRDLQPADRHTLQTGITLDDGPSRLQLKPLGKAGRSWQVTLHEGRNRQIRRSFAALGYTVTALHRTGFGDYQLGDLAPGHTQIINP